MQSLICEQPYSFTYHKKEIPFLQKGNAIIKIKRIGICGTDLHAYEGTQPYFNYPRILGHELSGELIDADNIDGFTPGEPVTILPYLSCGQCFACRSNKPNCCSNIQVLGVHTDGGMQEYISVPAELLIHPQRLSYDELALVEPFAIGAHGIRRAAVQKAEWVLVIGAGPIGLATMEFARIAGAQVIAMDVNNERLQFCTNNNIAHHTINAATEDVVAKLQELTSGGMPAVIVDATGNLKAINNAFQYMAHGGRFVLIGLQKEIIQFSHPEFHKREATLMSSRNATRADFEQVIHCMSNHLIEPMKYITHRIPFQDVKDTFEQLLQPSSQVIKAVIEMD